MKKTLTIIGLAVATLAGAQAQVLLGFDLSGQASPATFTAGTIATNLVTTSGNNTLTRTGLASTGASNSFGSNGWGNSATLVESDNYVSFTLQASSAGPGYEATFTQIQYAINGSNTAPGTGRWGYRIGSGAFTLQPTFSIQFAGPVALSAWDFTDFTTAQAVEFRFWAYGTTSVNGGVTNATSGAVRSPFGNLSGDDLIVNGSVTAIPEPATLGLALTAGLLALCVRRRLRIN